jgi:two-component system, NarL family, nitrate/nitrite response regulator NarL
MVYRLRGSHATVGRKAAEPRSLKVATPTGERVVVFAASSSAAVRRRWRQALGQGVVVREIGDVPALEQHLPLDRPDILLLDRRLCQTDQTRFRRLSARTRVVLFGSPLDDREGMAAIRAGARGYCELQVGPVMLKKMVARVQQGEIWISRKAIARMIAALTPATAYHQEPTSPGGQSEGLEGYPLVQLTLLKREIASLVARGANNKQIAHELHLAEKTVKAHLTAIFRRLRISNRLQLALLANSLPVWQQ